MAGARGRGIEPSKRPQIGFISALKSLTYVLFGEQGRRLLGGGKGYIYFKHQADSWSERDMILRDEL